MPGFKCISIHTFNMICIFYNYMIYGIYIYIHTYIHTIHSIHIIMILLSSVVYDSSSVCTYTWLYSLYAYYIHILDMRSADCIRMYIRVILCPVSCTEIDIIIFCVSANGLLYRLYVLVYGQSCF